MPAPLWPWFNEVPIYVARTLDWPHRPDDVYTCWSN